VFNAAPTAAHPALVPKRKAVSPRPFGLATREAVFLGTPELSAVVKALCYNSSNNKVLFLFFSIAEWTYDPKTLNVFITMKTDF